MSYNRKDIFNVATKLGRLVNGGVVGYYVGGKTTELMSNAIPEQIVGVVDKHKKIQLATSLAQSFVPGAGIAATAAATASLWKMYYDINNVLGIKISDNVGKSLTSAIVTNLSSFAAKGAATVVSEGTKFIPFVGWMASAAISTATSTAIIYGAAYLYLNALVTMYKAEGKFDINNLTSIISNDYYLTDNLPENTSNSSYVKLDFEEDIEEEVSYENFSQCLDAYIENNYDDIDNLLEQIDRLIYDCDNQEEEANLSLLGAVACLDVFIDIYNKHFLQESLLPYLCQGIDYINNASNISDTEEVQVIQSCYIAHYKFWSEFNFSSDFYNEKIKHYVDEIIENLSCNIFSEKYIESLYQNTFTCILYYCTPNGEEEIIQIEGEKDDEDCFDDDEIDTTESFNANSALTKEEEEYLIEYKDMLADGDLSDRDRRFLNKIMKANGISEVRAKEIEAMAESPSLTDEEQEYLDEYREIISEGEISARDQRYLDKLKKTNGISDSRAQKIEAMA